MMTYDDLVFAQAVRSGGGPAANDMESRLAPRVRGKDKHTLAYVLASVTRDAAEQRCAAADEEAAVGGIPPAVYKVRGNTRFKAGEYQAALLEYSAGIRGLKHAAVVLSKRAACATEFTLPGSLQQVVSDSCAALAVDAGLVEPRHRCALALLNLKYLKEAKVYGSLYVKRGLHLVAVRYMCVMIFTQPFFSMNICE